MVPLDIVLKYLEIFFSGRDFERLYEIFSENLKFNGPFYHFDSARDYIERLQSDPPLGCKYKIIQAFENGPFVNIIYEFSKPGVRASMSQLFEVRGQKITQIWCIKMSVFRAGVGAIIINENGKVMAFRRADIKDAWQLPQGGLKDGEEYIEGLFREIFEETGIARENLQLIEEYPDWLAYELPKDIQAAKNILGQVQKWFLLKFTGNEREIDPNRAEDDEFDAWQWMTLTELADRTIFFKKHIYRKLTEEFAEYLAK